MRRRVRQCHAIAGELSQRDDRKVPAHDADTARGPKTDAAHAGCRSAPGATEGKESRDSVREIVASDCRSIGETRANDFVFEPARFFHFSAVQQLRRGAQLSELQCRAHVSSAFPPRWIGFSEDDVRPIELSSVRAHRRCPQEMSGLRTRRADLLRLRYRKSGINSRPNFP